MGRLNNKIAVVTGAAMGMGFGISKVMAQEGAHVVMIDMNEKVFESAEIISNEGGSTTACKADVTDFTAVQTVIDNAARDNGGIDILVNNAGIARLVPFLEMDDATRDLHFDVNIKGVWNCSKAAFPHMVEVKMGRIINLSSVSGAIVADVGETAYAASKAAVWGFTKALAMEGAGHNICVNMICPGMVDTPMVRNVASEMMPENPQAVVDAIASSIPLKRLCDPMEVGHLATFLASDQAAYLTGQPFVIDGGSTLPESPLSDEE